MMKIDKAPIPLILPNPGDPRLTERVAGTDQAGAAVEIHVPVERPLTLYLNAQEIVTMMTIGDYPEYLALGYLLNQNMLKYDDVVTEVEYDDDLQVVVVRTEHHTNFEQKLKKRTQTSGCAQGTAFGDLLEAVESVALPKAELRTPCPRFIWRLAPFTAACCARKASLSATPRTSAATTPSTRSRAGCSATASIPPTRSSTPPGG